MYITIEILIHTHTHIYMYIYMYIYIYIYIERERERERQRDRERQRETEKKREMFHNTISNTGSNFNLVHNYVSTLPYSMIFYSLNGNMTNTFVLFLFILL